MGESGSDSESQITAFEDTWHWNLAAEARITHHRDTESTEKDQSKNLSDLSDSVVNTSYRVNGNNQMMAYLVMMAVRLKELHRVPRADRLALSPLRPECFTLFEGFVGKKLRNSLCSFQI